MYTGAKYTSCLWSLTQVHKNSWKSNIFFFFWTYLRFSAKKFFLFLWLIFGWFCLVFKTQAHHEQFIPFFFFFFVIKFYIAFEYLLWVIAGKAFTLFNGLWSHFYNEFFFSFFFFRKRQTNICYVRGHLSHSRVWLLVLALTPSLSKSYKKGTKVSTVRETKEF